MSDRPTWIGSVLEFAEHVGLVIEVIPWSNLHRLSGMRAATLIDATQPIHFEIGEFETFATRGWQPATVISVNALYGAAAFREELARLGYRSIHTLRAGDDYWTDLQRDLYRIVACHLWLLPLFKELCADADATSAETGEWPTNILARLVGRAEELRTVKMWAQRCGLTYHELENRFSDCGLPVPKRVFDSIRLARVLVAFANTAGPPTLEELARRFSYSSGRYLGIHVGRVTGTPFGDLSKRPLVEALHDVLRSAFEDWVRA